MRIALILIVVTGVVAHAADKSGVSPNSISLPKGPGSIEGLGESFQPTLNTGTAKYNVGIKVPPGVAGHLPSLKLSYEGGGGNGPLGIGWSLTLPMVQRRTDAGIPTYGSNVGFPRLDTFINESREELVPQANGDWFCKNESAFIRYRQVSNHWEGTQPDGTKMEFGLTPNGRIAEGGRVFTWLLERETDTRGNVILYTYQSFPTGQNLNQKYLASVRYGPGAGPWTHFHFVTFEYENRNDWFEDARAGFLVRTGKRLKRIFVGTQGLALAGHLVGDFNGDGTTDCLNRRYDLEYLQYAGPASHWSLLSGVGMTGMDGVTALPAIRFSYAVSNPPDQVSAQTALLSSINAPATVMDSDFVDLLDLNADGLPDLLKTELGGGAHTAYLNRGPVVQNGSKAVQWGGGTDVDPGSGTAWNFDLASERTHLADMNGDGLADLVHKTFDDAVFFFPNRGQVNWGAQQEMSTQDSTPPAPFGSDDVRTADLDFDKRIDTVQSIDIGGAVAYRVWFNLGGQNFSRAITIEPTFGFDFSVAGVQIADCNGDRVPDVTRVQAGAVIVLAGLGYGHFADAQSMVLPDTTLDDQQVARAKLTDINGDGLADLVLERASPGTCWYWLNLGNYTFSVRKALVDLPADLSADTAVRWADINGNGTTDLIYGDSEATPRIQAVEIGDLLSGGLAPNTLVGIDNGLGRVTRIDYAPSTKFALEDHLSGRPWPDPLPFPVTVVESVTESDSLGNLYVTQYRYHDGFYDYQEKQFRGFAQVEQIDRGDTTAPTLVTRSYFDTGREYEAMKGKLLRLTTETEAGSVFTDSTTRWTTPPRVLRTGTNGETVRFAHPVHTVEDIIEGGQGTARRTESESDFDNYGNQTRTADYGIVEGANRSAFDDERITIKVFALNTNAWILRGVKREEITDESGTVISRTESFYDDETFSGNNFGVVTTGNLTMKRAWLSPSNSAAYVTAIRTRYDGYGNPIAMIDPLGTGSLTNGHSRELGYDSTFHTYTTLETIHVGDGKPALVFEASYDTGLGTVTSSTDFNSHRTTYGYDALGRLKQVIRPGDDVSYPSSEYMYELGVLVGATGRVSYVETRLLDKPAGTLGNKRDHYHIYREFVDGLGRNLMKKEEAEAGSAGTPRVVVTGAQTFNARQKPSRLLNPFFSRQPGDFETQLSFENITAAGWEGAFQIDNGLVSRTLATAHLTAYEYDAALRETRTSNPDGSFGATVYEPLAAKVFDENDNDDASPDFATPTIEISDGLGRLVRVDQVVKLDDEGHRGPLATWTTRYQYDVNDCLIRITDAQNNVKELHYDGLRRKVFMTDLNRGPTTNVFDDASNLRSTTDGKGQRISYTYDGLNRLITEDFHDENSAGFSYQRSPDLVYVYDVPASAVRHGDGTQSTAQNTKGLLAYVIDATGEEHISYDRRGRAEWTVKQVFDPQRQVLVPYTTRLEHDAIDRITGLTYPDNDRVSYEFNERNLIRRIAGGPTGSIVFNIEYAPSAQQTRVVYGNGVQTEYAYDSRRRVANLRTAANGGQPELLHFHYAFDLVSNIKSIEDRRSTSLIPIGDQRRNTQTFAYDSLYRLTKVNYNPPSLTPTPTTNFVAYRYDRIGNMLEQTSDILHVDDGHSVTQPGLMTYGGGPGGRHNRTARTDGSPPGPHALTAMGTNGARSYTYDANGNMTDIEGMKCTWDYRDRLVAAEDETMRAEYRYDYMDRRTTRRVLFKGPSGQPTNSTATIYVNKHFEVRDAEQPTKYVFNGPTRVALVTGSLSNAPRIQRVRLSTGWNIVSLAITATNLLGQLQQQPSLVQNVYRWDEGSNDYVPVTSGQAVAANSVLWIKSSTNAVVGVSGPYAEPVNRTVPAGGMYVAGPGLEKLDLAGALPSVRGLWARTSPHVGWNWRLMGDLSSLNDLPSALAPGDALYVQSSTATVLEVPDAALRVRYYHQDHLGSSSVITDAAGALVEESAYYPFGMPRNEHRVRLVENYYGFTQKERDRESGLHYFEARFMNAAASRFISPDPKYLNPDRLAGDNLTDFLRLPGKGNLYAYALNNPVRYADPTGLDDLDKVTKGVDVVGLANSFAEATDALENNPAVKVAGKTVTVISLGVKGAQFIADPSADTGGQLAYEGTKTALSMTIPPVGVILAILDLADVGPSAALAAIEKSIKYNREATKHYKEATKHARETARIYNEGYNKIKPKLDQLRPKVEQLEKMSRETVAKIKENERRQQAEIKRLQREIRHLKRVEKGYKRLEKKILEQ